MELPQKCPRWVATLLMLSILADFNQSVNPGGRNVGQTQPFKKKAGPTRRPNLKTVLVKCHEDSLEVVVKGDLFDIGILVNGSDMHLGSQSSGSETAQCNAVQTGEAEFTIFAPLTACGTTFSSTETALVYSNVLIYSPSPPRDGVYRLAAASVPIECHYGKQYAVDSAALVPVWIPLVSTVPAEGQLDFSLRLMTDDWRAERESNTFSLGDVIHLEAAVIVHKHMPLRVHVDHCVATETPDAESYANLRHDFIDYYGCLTDGQLTGSGSRYMPRVQNDKLNIMLDAFRFFQAPTDMVFITCHLKAVRAISAVDSRNRACSFIANRWRSADGHDQACKSCEVSQRFAKFTAPTTATTVKPTTPKPYPASFFRVRPGLQAELLPKAGPTSRRPSSSGWKRGTDTTREWRRTTTVGPLFIVTGQEVIPSKTAPATLQPMTTPVETVRLEAVHPK
ncbi:zona pellucida sperm-binding protein 3 [Esox lucius]|uniref:zona pellucida sperm-binding protein 3 n=1 Tax=Esox lucius TaxID=8010 RepID=UPI00147771E1|nr:zona pellucida sperm-binding protein 3 [Esox lucius]